MENKNLAFSLIILASAAISFGAGIIFQGGRYENASLELGGRRISGENSICVIEQDNAVLSLGPILVTSSDIVTVKRRENSGGHSMVGMTLKPEIAAALEGYTKESIGQELQIRIAGRLTNSVRIQEPIKGGDLLIAFTEKQAEQLISILSPEKQNKNQ